MLALAATEGAQQGSASAPGVAKQVEERMNECNVLTLLRTCHDGQNDGESDDGSLVVPVLVLARAAVCVSTRVESTAALCDRVKMSWIEFL
jgi:hypothetical protein